MNTAEIIQDFRRRYEGTFCWLEMEELTKETLVRVTRVEDSASKGGVLHLDSSDFGTLTVNIASEGYALRFKYPPVGVFQHDADALQFTRRPQRQYARGICTGNSVLRNVTANFVGNRARFTASEVRSAFEHKTFSVADALFELSRGRVRSIALDNNFSISLSVTLDPDYIVYHWIYPVARLNKHGKITRIYSEIYKKSLQELFG